MSTPTTIEFRPRGKAAPEGLRIFLGRPTSKKEARRLEELRDLLHRLARRGDWDVLVAIKERALTAEAVAALVDQFGISDYRAHLDVEPTVGPTLSEHVARWLDTVTKASTRDTYRHAIKHLTCPYGDRVWFTLDGSDIAEARAEMERQGLTNSTRRTAIGSWGSFFTWAIHREEDEAAKARRKPYISANPVRVSVSRKSVPSITARHRFLTREEFHELLDVAAPDLKAQYATLILCALRITEFFHLPPQHVHLPTHIHIGPWGDWAPKGYPRYTHGVGDVPIEQSLLRPLLEEYAELYAGERNFFVNPRTGDGWTYEAFRRRFDADMEAAGMKAGQFKGGERVPSGVTPHTCRHTLPSWLAQDDVQILKIAKIIRDTPETAIRHYAQLLPQHLDEAINKVFG